MMKKILFLILFSICLNKSYADIKISGKIYNAEPNSKIVLSYYSDIFYINEIKKNIEIDFNGNFFFNFNIDQPRIIDFRIGKSTINIFINTADNLYLEADYNKPINTIIFKGKTSKDNYFLIEDSRQNIQIKANQIQNFKDSRAYSLYLDSLQKEYTSFYENYNKVGLSIEVKEFLYHKMKYQLMDNRWMYRLDFSSKSGKIENRKLDSTYFNYLDTINLNDINASKNNYYRTALMRYLFEKVDSKSYLSLPKELSDNQKIKYSRLKIYNFRKRIFLGDVLDIQLTEFIKRNYEQIKIDSFFCDSILNDFYLSCNNEEYKNNIKSYIELKNSIKKGSNTPDIILDDINGNKLNLSQFKGKYIYIDFWATWCKPCIANMNDSKILINEFKDNNDVLFIFINTKDNKNNWHSYLNKNKSNKEIHLFADEETTDIIFKNFKFSSLPHYVFIDENFKIFDSNAKPPSQIKNDILNLINK